MKIWIYYFYWNCLQSAPFTQLKVSDEPLEGNDRFEGYCIDLLKEMKGYMEKNMGVEFKYIIHQVYDGRYGSQKKDSPDGGWDGMVGELMENVRAIHPKIKFALTFFLPPIFLKGYYITLVS